MGDIIRVKEAAYDLTQGEIINTVDVRGNQWTYKYKNAEPVHKISPRIGIAYPITDRGAIHFSYGHFYQIPTFEQLYHNPEFEVWPGGLGVRIGSSDYEANKMGNAELKPQQTVIYEIGLQQQLSDDIGIDITGFYKDIKNLLGTEIINTYTQDKYARYINRDYGNVRGFTLALKKRRSNYVSATMDYTYQVAEGNASDPDAAYHDARSNKESEIQVVSLDWDQTHTLNMQVTVSQPGSWGVSLIGRLGSGLPYNPKVVDVGTTFENSERKPPQYTFDLRAHKDFRLRGLEYSIFLKVYNLFDRKNEIIVYPDTGRAGYTIVPRGSVRGVNTLEEYLNRPNFYSEPRRVISGVSLEF
jgi:outer membrane receptor for ferrienterochelin and colicin